MTATITLPEKVEMKKTREGFGRGRGDDTVLAGELTVIGMTPIRLVNQLESGTSSIVLTFCARTFDVGSPGFVSRFSSVS